MTAGPIPVTLPRVSPHTQPAATQANTPVPPDPHLTRDVQTTTQAITAADKTDNPVSDQVRQREGQRQRTGRATGADTDDRYEAGPVRQASGAPEKPGPLQVFDEVERGANDEPPLLDTFA